MRRLRPTLFSAGGLIVFAMLGTAVQAQLPFFHKSEAVPVETTPLEQIARTLDRIEDSVRDDGIVVIKQPDVWGQARMTKYRREFEQMFLTQMLTDTAKFDQGLQALITRADQASFENRTALAGVATPTPRGSNGRRTEITASPAEIGTSLTTLTTNTFNAAGLPGTAADSTKNVTAPAGPFANPFDTTGGLLSSARTAFNIGASNPAAAIEPTVKLDELKNYIDHGHRLRQNQQGDDTSDSAGYGLYLIRMPVSIQPGETTVKGHGAIVTATMYHDFTNDYLAATFRNLVINDLVDQLGPAVYQLLREDVPDRLREAKSKFAGTQARLDAAKASQASLLANIPKIIDKLADAIDRSRSELIAGNTLGAAVKDVGARDVVANVAAFVPDPGLIEHPGVATTVDTDNLILKAQTIQRSLAVSQAVQRRSSPAASNASDAVAGDFGMQALLDELMLASRYLRALPDKDRATLQTIATDWVGQDSPGTVDDLVDQFLKALDLKGDVAGVARKAADAVEADRTRFLALRKSAADEGKAAAEILAKISNLLASAFPSTRFGTRIYPVAPSDLDAVFFPENLLALAEQTKLALITRTPRATDIRAFLRNQLQTAYDVLETYDDAVVMPEGKLFVDLVAENIGSRRFDDDPHLRTDLRGNYAHLLEQLVPGDLKVASVADSRFKPRLLHALCWAVTVEAGLLNQQLRKDMRNIAGVNGFVADGSDGMSFHFKMPSQAENDPRHPYWAAQEMFTRYVQARWPIITFSLDPVTDQQNIADAYSRERDLQLAVAFAFSSGRINFSQMNRYIQKLRYEAATVDLNRTVTSFAYGNDTFGWRFSPRYQNPPDEPNNLSRLANLVVKGGPGRNYGAKNSKLEAGQRELTAVVIMPSILQRIRMDVNTNWYPLHDPDQMRIPTPRMIKQGRQIVELRESLNSPDLCRHYRPGDVQRVATRVKQLEAMLPMQTLPVQVPYENTLGGFQLFSQGSTSLVPELLGYEGLDTLDPARGGTIFLYGKHISIHETNVVAGGALVAGSLGGALPAAPSAAPPAAAAAPAATASPAPAAASPAPAAASPAPAAAVARVEAEILSREVIRVTIPANVSPSTFKEADDGGIYLEVYLATPNGISNRLMIPVLGQTLSQRPVGPKPPTPAPPPTSGFTLNAKSKAMTVGYQWRGGAKDMRILDVAAKVDPEELAIDWYDSVGVGPRSVDVEITVAMKDKPLLPLGVFSFTSKGGPYVQKSKDVALRLAAAIQANMAFRTDDLLPATAAATFKVVPKSGCFGLYQTDPSPRTMADTMTITLNPVSIPPTSPAPSVSYRSAPRPGMASRTAAPNPATAPPGFGRSSTGPIGAARSTVDAQVGRAAHAVPPANSPPARPYGAPSASPSRSLQPSRPSTPPPAPLKPERRSIFSRMTDRSR